MYHFLLSFKKNIDAASIIYQYYIAYHHCYLLHCKVYHFLVILKVWETSFLFDVRLSTFLSAFIEITERKQSNHKNTIW